MKSARAYAYVMCVHVHVVSDRCPTASGFRDFCIRCNFIGRSLSREQVRRCVSTSLCLN